VTPARRAGVVSSAVLFLCSSLVEEASGRRNLGQPYLLSTQSRETIDVEQAKLPSTAVRRTLGAEEYHYFAALHHDADRDRLSHAAGRSTRHRCVAGRATCGRIAPSVRGRRSGASARMGLQVDRPAKWRSKLGEGDLSLVPEVEAN
jgi:hypothetical protein